MPATAIRLGLAMTAFQVSIGVLNDLVDAPRDVGRIPPKPIPAGLVSAGQARVGLVIAAVVGLGLSAPSGAAAVGLAIVVLVIGYGYDLVAKGTPWSWLPFALGIPLLPVFAWVGTLGAIPDRMGIVVIAAVLAGAALAIANARADVEQDRASGTASVATVLGLRRSWWVASGLLAVVATIAVAAIVADRARGTPSFGAIGLVVAGIALIVAGGALGQAGTPARRERAWELSAVGVAVLAVGYLVAIAAVPR